MSRLACAVLATALLAACSAEPERPPMKGNDGPAPQESPERLYGEFVSRLSAADGPGTCALFTPAGQVAFQEEWGTTACDLGVTAAAGELADPAAFAAKKPESTIRDSETVVEMSGCGVGAMKAISAEGGWLIDAFLHPNAVEDC
jgi:hypothetical protein